MTTSVEEPWDRKLPPSLEAPRCAVFSCATPVLIEEGNRWEETWWTPLHPLLVTDYKGRYYCPVCNRTYSR